MTQQIGLLVTDEPRQLFPNEAGDFTTWLEKHIEVLGDRLGLKLSNAEREQAVGSFSVDLRAEDGDGRLVVIENQLERTDHTHLGQVLTYLVNLEAKIAIWISPAPRPEHVRVIQWLNEITPADAAFYLVKVEAVRIEDSPLAPLFIPLVGPSEEARAVGSKKKELTQERGLWHEFWTQLADRSYSRTDLLKGVPINTWSSWLTFDTGRPGLRYNFSSDASGALVRLEIYRGQGKKAENDAIFDQLQAQQEDIQRRFGTALNWDKGRNRQTCRVEQRLGEGVVLTDRAAWTVIQDQMIDAMIRLDGALRPHIEKLDLS